MIPARRTAVVILASLVALPLSACGSSSDKPSSAAEILKDTFGPGKPVKSGNLDLGVSFDGTGLQGVNGPVKVTLTGPFQSQGGKTLPAFAFDASLNAGGTTFTAGAVSTGTSGFLKFQGASYALTPALYTSFKKGYEASAKDTGTKGSSPSFRSLGVDPLRWLTNPKKVGTEPVGDTDTTHISATVDVPKLLADVDTLLGKAGKIGGAAGQSTAGVPKGLTAGQRKTIQDAVTSSSFDVWAGKDDGTLRKLDVKVLFDVPAGAQAKAGGLKKGTLDIVLTITDLNKAQKITAPTGARPLSELQAQAAQLLGGGATGTGTSSSPATPATPATPAAPTPTTPAASTTPATPSSPYLRCLQAAGSDIAKVNACAKLQ